MYYYRNSKEKMAKKKYTLKKQYLFKYITLQKGQLCNEVIDPVRKSNRKYKAILVYQLIVKSISPGKW